MLTVGFVGSLGRACFSDLVLRTTPGVEVAYCTGSRRGLLALLARGRVDIVVYPGGPAVGLATRPLCNDRLALAMRAAHPCAGTAAWTFALLRAATLAVPDEGGAGDFRHLVRGALPDLGPLAELPLRDLVQAIGDSDLVGLVSVGHTDELGVGIITREIAGVTTDFTIHLAWGAVTPAETNALIAALKA